MTNINCDRCGLGPMYWCKDCETNSETNTCDNCGRPIEIDEDYHNYCPEMTNQKITIPFSEMDIEELRSGEEFHWSFPTDKGEIIDVHIRPEKEEDIDSEFTKD